MCFGKGDGKRKKQQHLYSNMVRALIYTLFCLFLDNKKCKFKNISHECCFFCFPSLFPKWIRKFYRNSQARCRVLPHRNAMPQTQDTTPHPVTVYRHGANLSLCYPSMWNVTLEYTATHFNVLGETRPGNPSPTFHTHQRTFNLMLSLWSTVGSSVESTNRVLNPGPVVCESSTLSARPQRLQRVKL